MKLKERCEETGLSRKAIRLYEEKGLFQPDKEYRNGREYRLYTQEDAEQLKMVAALRRAWFTMEEISSMQQDPAAIQEIFPQYRQWLLAQRRQLEGLLAAAEQIDLEAIENVRQLSAHMSEEASKLPLPRVDVEPHFQYLDAMEGGADMRKQKYQEQREKAFRQTALVMDRDRVNDQAITFGQFRDMRAGAWEDSGPVKREDAPPRWMALLSRLGGFLLAAGVVLLCFGEIVSIAAAGRGDRPASMTVGFLALVAGAVLYGGIQGLRAYQERQRWLRLVRQQEQEKRK